MPRADLVCMSEYGGGSEPHDDSAPEQHRLVIPVTTTPVRHPDSGPDVSPPPAALRPRPSARFLVWTLVAVLVLGIGAYAAVHVKQERDAAALAKDLADYEQALNDVRPVVADYSLPSAVESRNDCLMTFACGSSDLEVQEAVEVVLPTFAKRGLDVGPVECQPNHGPTDAACRSELNFHGQPVGFVSAYRDDIAFRAFGVPTSVSVSISGLDTSSTSKELTVTEADLRDADLPQPYADRLRCNTVKDADGCGAYLALGWTEDKDGDWRAFGRALVHDGWRSVDGFCGTGAPSEMCSIDAQRVVDGRELHVFAMFKPQKDGVRTIVRLTVVERVPS